MKWIVPTSRKDKKKEKKNRFVVAVTGIFRTGGNEPGAHGLYFVSKRGVVRISRTMPMFSDLRLEGAGSNKGHLG